jgi:hypothetical protein
MIAGGAAPNRLTLAGADGGRVSRSRTYATLCLRLSVVTLIRYAAGV